MILKYGEGNISNGIDVNADLNGPLSQWGYAVQNYVYATNKQSTKDFHILFTLYPCMGLKS